MAASDIFQPNKSMPFQVTVRETKPLAAAELGHPAASSEQIYEQTVETLDLSKLIGAVNHKPRLRKTRTATPTRG